MACLHGLKAGQKGRVLVYVAYACLQKAHFFVVKAGHGPQEKVGRRQAVRIKDGYKFAFGLAQAEGEVAGLVACALFPAQMTNVDTLLKKAGQHALHKRMGFVRGIVQDKDFQPVPGIVQGAHRLKKLADDEFLVADRQEYRDGGKSVPVHILGRGVHVLKGDGTLCR